MTSIQPAGRGGGGGGVSGGPSSSSLADVIDTILDKGLVIDAYVRVSLVGIELLTIDARVVVASVDTYLRFAEAVNRLEIGSEPKGLTDLAGGGAEDGAEDGAESKTQGALGAVGEKLGDILGGGKEEPERERVSRKSTREDK
ncbi:gas vesicle structural protein GvpA [Rhodococcus pseudokoreensis]|uniref:Gas vesicle protein A n=1 Tax=Rhodococcus pseudokoreensis TaxID=2811421 RepID=A0A974W3B4_9NOCA|nr:gas vesicle protein GvpJ [Rhodococcus pseudokoreensis]QSE89872.1 gas vesicle structural protein GvpA [Rhodococcus pseudokoreensis]